LLRAGTQVAIATAVASGTIAPYPPLDSIAAPTFGDPLASASLTITSDLGETWSNSWGEALARGNLTGLDSLKGYTAVYVGPNPWAGQDGPVNWNDPKITVVSNSPQ
ncbi:MAG TPA: hypothetical protein VL137_03880, partial [Polyangiaceae bacterium]|nr:hypothetical protein [Polyangiaceae bacterium]